MRLAMMTIFISMAFLFLAKSTSPSPVTAPSPSDADCTTIIYDMADCLSYISKGSKDKKPTPSCCSGLESVLNVNAMCLCEALKNSKQLGIDVDLQRAGSLPSACGVSAPPISKCDVSSPPTQPPSAHTPNQPPSSNSPSQPPSSSTPSKPPSVKPPSATKSPPSESDSPAEAPGTTTPTPARGTTTPTPASNDGGSSTKSASDAPRSNLSGFFLAVMTMCMVSLSYMSM